MKIINVIKNKIVEINTEKMEENNAKRIQS